MISIFSYYIVISSALARICECMILEYITAEREDADSMANVDKADNVNQYENGGAPVREAPEETVVREAQAVPEITEAREAPEETAIPGSRV